MHFEIVGKITNIEIIAVGEAIRDLPRLQERYGPGRWRKLKGIAMIRLFEWQDSPGRNPLVRSSRHW